MPEMMARVEAEDFDTWLRSTGRRLGSAAAMAW
jgi:hypothetical protein